MDRNTAEVRGNRVLRAADGSLGRLLIAAVGLGSKRSQPRDPRHVGVLKTAAIGDTVLLSAILADLRAGFPGARLTLITGGDNAAAGALVAPPHARNLTISVTKPVGALRALRDENFDVLIDAGSWPRIDAALVALSGARFRVGFRTPGQHRHYAFDRTVDHSNALHELENFRSLVRALGVETRALPSIATQPLPASPRLPAAPFAVFHPWAGGFRAHLREWPAERWSALALEIRDIAPRVAVTAPAHETSRCAALIGTLRAARIDAVALEGLSLPQLASALRQAVVLVSVNTGIMHLGAALGVPTVGLHGPTSEKRWGPIGPATRAVSSSFAGCGYLNLGFEYSGHRLDCMDGVSLDDVVRATWEAVAEAPRGERSIGVKGEAP